MIILVWLVRLALGDLFDPGGSADVRELGLRQRLLAEAEVSDTPHSRR
jgi:hypothetical protein